MKQAVKKIVLSTPGLRELKLTLDRLRVRRSIASIDKDLRTGPLVLNEDPENPLLRNFGSNLAAFRNKRKLFGKIVIWGFRHELHTHRFIHRHFYDTLIKLGEQNLRWLDDTPGSQKEISEGDLVIAMNMACKHLPYLKGVYYCLHNIQNEARLSCRYIDLQVFHNRVPVPAHEREYWEKATFFCPKNKTLYQPWGTDLLPQEFLDPVFNGNSRKVYWIGSIWNNIYNQGNIEEMAELKQAVKENGLRFVHLENVSVSKNIRLVRESRIAPAISGRFQAEVDYLPCRVFKNVSYGQCAITNVAAFQELLGDSAIKAKTISGLVSQALSLSEREYIEKVRSQQDYIANHHTYLNKFINIFTAIERTYF